MIARLEQQICEMKDEVGYVQDAAECKDPELKYGEGSWQSFSFADGNHVSEDNLSRDVFGSPVLNSSSVHAQRSFPVPGASSSSSSQAPVPTRQVHPFSILLQCTLKDLF